MTNAKRGSGSHRGVCLGIAAALGFAFAGWGIGGAQAQESTAYAPPTASIGAVTINWMPPTENVGGIPLTNLAGYDIHYGTASHDYTKTINVANPGITTYVVDDLAPGKYYFSVTAVDSNGTESSLSPEVSATVE